MEGFGDAPGLPELMIIVVVVGLMIVPQVFYLLALQRALSRCSAECRTLAPRLVWLLFIPFFNLVWSFVMVIKISTSLANEFTKRGIAGPPNPGRSIGLAMAICGVLALIPVPFVGGPLGVGALVCWIVYWVKIAGFSSKIEVPQTV